VVKLLSTARWLLLVEIASLALSPIILADSTTPVTIAFSRSGSSQPRYCTFNGSSWSASTAMPSIGGEANWVILKNCPKRNELAFAALDDQNDVNVTIFNGATSAWSTPVEVTNNTFQHADRCMALEYENVSGDFLVVYWNQTGGGYLGYRTYNGSSVSAESTLALPSGAKIRYSTLSQRRYSNELMLLAMNDSGGLYAAVWNGCSFGAVTTIETNIKTDGIECFAGEYETISGDYMVVYSESGQSTPRYRIYDGTTWSVEASLPTVGATINWIRLVADPTSNKMIFASLDTSDDLNANVWTGSAWGTNQELETTVGATSQRKFDLAYMGGSNIAVLVYGQGTLTTAKYRYWTGSWSAASDAMDQGDKPAFISGITSQVANQVYFATSDTGGDLTVAWSAGMTFATLETTLGGTTTTEPYMMATAGPTPPTPANTPYANDFQGSIGAEWTNTTNTTNATYTKFLGRFHDESVRLALNTTPGQTYSLSFDLYTIDSWDGNRGGGYGPDNFIVKANGSTIFSHSFVHETPSYDQTYPFPPDQVGNFGFSSPQDGIFRSVEAVFTASCNLTTLTFAAAFTDPNYTLADESWGIDNIAVRPATFIDVSTARNFNVQVTDDPSMGAGIHWADLDNDGDLDAILEGNNLSRLMLYNFATQTYSASTFGGGGVREQGVLGDFDNDGDLDFWSPEAGSDGVQRMFRNNGSAVFTDIGACGFSGTGTWNEGAATVDANQDGWSDLIVFSQNGNWIGHNQLSSTPAFVSTANTSYGLNDAGDSAGIGYCASGDINNDGILDFFFRHNNGKLFIGSSAGTYSENSRGITCLTGGTSDTASAWGDYNNDGVLDLFIPRMTGGYSGSLWRNDVNWAVPSGNFTDVSSSAGLTLNARPASPSTLGTRSGCWGDYDNDGDLDLFIVGANGNCMLYENQGSGVLARTARGTTITGDAHDAVFVDYDNDGDLDLCITRESATCILLENQTNNTNYLKVRLVGRGSGGTNKAAIGTRVELWNSAGTTLLARRDVGIARGYGGTEPLWVHFGGVNPSTTYTVKAYFNSATTSQTVTPNAVSTTIGSRTISQLLTITESAKTSIVRWSEVRNHP
jgi:hypothetical protein